MRDNDSMLKGSVASALVRFAMPLMLANIFQVLYGAVDLFVVGNFATTADVSGVSTGSIMMNVIFINISALTTGCTVVIGQLTGAKKWEELGKAVGSAIAFFGAIAIGCAVALIAFVNVIIAVLNAPAEAIAQTRAYIVICSAGLPLNIGYTLTSCIMRGRGNSKAPLLFVAVACVVNIVTDLLLVAKFNMGAAGAALATIMSQGFSLLFAIVYL
ncbi:MAG: polysaccharide biosynthesis C-terminal domain-containing protein, partial [Oscillospiraceae bacterium]|nr:polysaccharide biosynthesis C-terminal domain-containing protein [Oscillospiraceae bacterium]